MNALNRQRDWKTFTRLPRECSLETPDWPIEVPNPQVAELAMWDRLWRLPQAHVWHADRVTDTVALYVRQFIEAAQPKASSQTRINVRQLAETLYLTSDALTKGHYVIVESSEDEVLQQGVAAQTGTDGRSGAAAGARPGQQRRSAKKRFVVVGEPGPQAGDNDVDDENEVDPDA